MAVGMEAFCLFVLIYSCLKKKKVRIRPATYLFGTSGKEKDKPANSLASSLVTRFPEKPFGKLYLPAEQ